MDSNNCRELQQKGTLRFRKIHLGKSGGKQRTMTLNQINFVILSTYFSTFAFNFANSEKNKTRSYFTSENNIKKASTIQIQQQKPCTIIALYRCVMSSQFCRRYLLAFFQDQHISVQHNRHCWLILCRASVLEINFHFVVLQIFTKK